MRKFGLFFAIFLLHSLGAAAHESSPGETEAPAEAVTIQDLMLGVVKIQVDDASVFGAARGGGHGSGFLVNVDAKTGRGIIFTNRHVIETSDLKAQKITVEFPTDQRRPEVIDGKLIFVSRVHDFAVLEVDLAQLKRARPRVLAMPDPERSPFFDFVAHERQLRGQKVLSIGHPLDGSNISTHGQITGLSIDPHDGPYIQTQTPSNPGNSGGPLISELTGEVIGITSAGVPRADGVNFSLPIGIVMREFWIWRAQVAKGITPNVADPRYIEVYVKELNSGDMATLGLKEKVEKHLPGYWNEHEYALTVAMKDPASKLEVDDILLTLNGQVIGGWMYDLFRLAQESPLEAEYEVLRKGRVVKVKTAIANMARNHMRRSVDYVYISGMLLQEMPERARMMNRADLASRVYVSGIVNSPETQFIGHKFPPMGSVVTAVKFGNKEYRIKNLFELKRALNAHRGEKVVMLRAHRSNIFPTGDGNGFIARSNMNQTVLLDGPEDIFVIPMRDVLTPMQFSLHQFKRQFSFAPDAAETWDWRTFVRRHHVPSSCEKLLKKPPVQKAATK